MKKFPVILRKPGAILSLIWLVLLVFGSITGPLWLPYDPTEQIPGSENLLPSSEYWLGTDSIGRDIFSRVVQAGAINLYGSMYFLIFAFGLGIPMALWAAEKGGKVEQSLSRLSDVIFALPATVMILALVGAIGPVIEAITIFFGCLVAPGVYRIMLGQFKSVRQRMYVDAARLNGLNSFQVNFRHVLPAAKRVLVVQVALLFAVSILIQAGLSFLGIGPQEPNPSWGAMISAATMSIYENAWLMVPPGLVLVLTVLSANALAEVLGGGDPALAKPRMISTAVNRHPVRADEKAAARKTNSLLELSELVVSVAGKHELVSRVSLNLKAGQVLGLVGESGCGKTMTALSVIGLLPSGVEVTSGSIFWNGEDTAGWTEKQKQKIRGSEIAFISQEPMVALDPMFTVQSQLSNPLRRFHKITKSAAKTRALELLKQVGIQNAERVMKSYPHQLSGGMAQRVAIALALTGDPKLLIADEPTTALDVTIQAEILDLLRSLIHQRDMAMIVVTHNLGVVADIADQVAVMYAGQVVESGSAAEVLMSPAHPYTAALLGADPHVSGNEAMPDRLASIPGAVPTADKWTNSCRFADRCDFATEVCKGTLVEKKAHSNGTIQCLRSVELKLSVVGRKH
jgi:peptide/nickel transport system permease protein